MTILNSAEWRHIKNRSPLLDKELKKITEAICKLEAEHAAMTALLAVKPAWLNPPKCTGEWLSGSGGHRVHKTDCTNNAEWWHPDDMFAYCAEHIVEHDKPDYWPRAEWAERLAKYRKDAASGYTEIETQEVMSALEKNCWPETPVVVPPISKLTKAIELLRRLGKNSWEVCAALQVQGIRGQRNSVSQCPVGKYLARKGIDPETQEVMSALEKNADLQGVRDFAKEFDAGKFEQCAESAQ